jgi:uncharacterized protein (DUF924 family)
MTTAHPSSEEIHRFWFADSTDDPQAAKARSEVWFRSSRRFDEECRRRFEPAIAAAARGELADWERAPRPCVSLVIVLDQLPRNIYRNTAAAFTHDAQALDIAKRGVAAGYLDALSPPERAFLLMPYQHMENAAIQRESVRLFERVHAQAAPEWRELTGNNLEFARRHLEIIERFGRFPHRNAALGRASTAEEREYLDSKPNTFGQGG